MSQPVRHPKPSAGQMPPRHPIHHAAGNLRSTKPRILRTLTTSPPSSPSPPFFTKDGRTLDPSCTKAHAPRAHARTALTPQCSQSKNNQVPDEADNMDKCRGTHPTYKRLSNQDRASTRPRRRRPLRPRCPRHYRDRRSSVPYALLRLLHHATSPRQGM